MRALKGLVIAMGALIVIGLTVVVVTIAMRATGAAGGGEDAADPSTASGDMAPRPDAPTSAGARPFGELQLGMADSCRIADAVASGGALVVRVDGPAKDGCDQLVVVDPAQGRVLGRIRPGATGSGSNAEAGQ